ncbi:MAG: Bax inhibitor-1 family protein, partial [Oscillospiraceae bacterium]|nr:Bax inhibitor-1 family protein [Oscillospiraceae bacterium]
MDNNNFYESEKLLEQQSREQQGLSRSTRREDNLGQELLGGDGLKRYTAKTFLNMFLGLMVSFGTAFFLTLTIPGFYLFLNLLRLTDGYLHVILLVLQLALAWGMTSAVQKSSVGKTWVFFIAHCALIGLVVGTWLLYYSMEMVTFAFVMAALYFGGMAVFGFVTNIDLSRMRNILITGLIFLIIANIAMWFIPVVGVTEQIICSIGVVLFLAYTAYD